MDNLPTVIMEAMAAGLPVVSTRLAGIPEMVIDGETGRLVAERDWTDFASALADLLADAEMRERLGEAGRKLAQRLFAKEVTARQLRRALVGGGLVGVQASWFADDPRLVLPVLRQAGLRLARLVGMRRRRKQKFPEK
jgi:hypothetical protein